MKKANLPVRADEWENEGRGSRIGREREENSVEASLCMKEGN